MRVPVHWQIGSSTPVQLLLVGVEDVALPSPGKSNISARTRDTCLSPVVRHTLSVSKRLIDITTTGQYVRDIAECVRVCVYVVDR